MARLGAWTWLASAALLTACPDDPSPAVVAEPEGAPELAKPAAVAKGETAPSPANSEIPWFEGSVEAAFERAERTGQPVFLYWGAQWCPPCHEIKRHVFTQPRFRALLSAVVPVYLDGDTEAAQQWGERLGAAGYPTLLLLSPDRRELMRFSGVPDVDAFARAFETALASNRPIAGTLRLALAGRADDDDWRLLSDVSWMQAPRVDLDGEARLVAQKELAEGAPSKLTDVRAKLAGALLAASAAQPDVPTARAVLDSPHPYADALLADADARFAARAYLLEGGELVLAALEADLRADLAPRWIGAVRELAKHPDAPPDLALEAAWSEIQIRRLLDPAAELPADLVERARTEALAAEARATTTSDRHAVISKAGHTLAAVGEVDAAREILEAELERSDTPWYYAWTLSRIEHNEGNSQAALRWAADGADAAKGTATRIQWAVQHLKAAVAAEAYDELPEIARRYYDLAMELPDGFEGRNWGRAQTVAALLAPYGARPDVAQVLETERARCTALPETAELRCRRHFDQALSREPRDP